MSTDTIICERQTFDFDPGDHEYLSTDAKLRERCIRLISQNAHLKPFMKDISRLINDKVIVPVVVKKQLLHKILHILLLKNLTYAKSTSILGFHSSKSNKMFIIMSKDVDDINGREISSVIIHELQHYISYNFPNEFYALHKNEISKFYQRFAKHMWNIDNKDLKSCETFGRLLYYVAEVKRGYNRAKIDAILHQKLLMGDQRAVNDYIYVLESYLRHHNNTIQSIVDRRPPFYEVFYNLHKTYKSLWKHSINSMCIQELFIPSEIIAINSEKNFTSKHLVLLKKIGK